MSCSLHKLEYGDILRCDTKTLAYYIGSWKDIFVEDGDILLLLPDKNIWSLHGYYNQVFLLWNTKIVTVDCRQLETRFSKIS